DLADPLGVGLGVGEAQGRAPGAADHLPAVDAALLADTLHVRHQVPGGVVLEVGMGGRAAAAALVEQDDAVGRRIMEPAHELVAAAARTAMDQNRRLALGIAALFPVDVVDWRNLDPPRRIGLNRWIGYHFGTSSSAGFTADAGPVARAGVRVVARCDGINWR